MGQQVIFDFLRGGGYGEKWERLSKERAGTILFRLKDLLTEQELGFVQGRVGSNKAKKGKEEKEKKEQKKQEKEKKEQKKQEKQEEQEEQDENMEGVVESIAFKTGAIPVKDVKEILATVEAAQLHYTEGGEGITLEYHALAEVFFC